MTCEGTNWVAGAFLGDCSMSWLTLVIVVFIALILRRQAEDGFLSGMGFNVVGALGVGLGLDILLVTLFGSPRWALLAGIAGVAIGGFLLGMIWDQAEGGSE